MKLKHNFEEDFIEDLPS